MLSVVAIVEGHGEVAALPILLRRIASELLDHTYVDVSRPIRHARSSLLNEQKSDLERALKLASLELQTSQLPHSRRLILLMVDADDDCPKELAPKLLARSQAISHEPIGVVLPYVEFETWFVAAAESLKQYLKNDVPPPQNPETTRSGKKWIAERFLGVRYSETVDQPKLAAAMDLKLCRDRSPSFDKLCRVLEQALA